MSTLMQTVPQVLANTLKNHAGRIAYRERPRGADGKAQDAGYNILTWGQVHETCAQLARALMASGVGKGDAVGILSYNCTPWLLADVGAILAGALPFGIYSTSAKEQCTQIVDHARARVVFVENQEQAQKLAELDIIRVQFFGPITAGGLGETIAWDAFLARGEKTDQKELERVMSEQTPDDPCTLIYTSGTTGDPKAVVLTHTNLFFESNTVISLLSFDANDRAVSYLPMSHIAEQVLTIHAPMQLGSSITFATSVEKATVAIADTKPTYFMGVPRVWEKMHAKIAGAVAEGSTLKRKLFGVASDLGLKAARAKQRGGERTAVESFADRMLMQKVRAKVGLEQCRYAVTGAAPISKQTLEFIWSLGIPVYEAYGMSESTGTTTISLPNNFRIGSVGRPLPGTEVKLESDGEICLRGPHVFKEYRDNPEATRETIDADGWLHTGDIGKIDEDGFLYVTDRKKELLITAGGENVAPSPIEGLLRAIPGIAQAVVVGDRQKYLVVLLVLDAEKLHLFEGLSPADGTKPTIAQVAKSEAARKVVQGHIDQINTQLARVQTIKKFALLPSEFAVGDELTPTMKLKRKVILAKYGKAIADMYGADAV
jgi:long-subunit acyl-CoA synthetase (AMP-forming)